MSSNNPSPSASAGHPVDRSDAGRPRGAFRVGSLRGTPIYIGASWFVIAILLAFVLGPQIGRVVPGLGWGGYGAGLLYSLLLLASVLVHEFAHALAARRFGYRVERIVADLLGGHTMYQTVDPSPGRQAWIAVVGPLANGVLALIGGIVTWFVSDPLTWVLLGALTWTNAFVAVFNLLPGMPLDGGHVVEALVWKATGKRHQGMFAAGWMGRLLILGLAAYLLVGSLRGTLAIGLSLWNLLLFGLIGAYLWAGSTESIRAARLLGALGQVDVRRLLHPVRVMAMTAPLRAIPPPGPDEDGRLPAVIVVVDESTAPPAPLGYLDPQAATKTLQAGAQEAPASSCLRACSPRWVVDVAREAVTPESLARWMNERHQPVLLLRDSGWPYAVVEANILAGAIAR